MKNNQFKAQLLVPASKNKEFLFLSSRDNKVQKRLAVETESFER
jgi:hypothetical protein